jgi:predicted porin
VTLYGVLDANYGVRKATGSIDVVSGDLTRVIGGASDKRTGLMDGSANGLSGSRWGLKGSEDLGGGMKANFVLESAISIDTGASTGFTRNALVGVSGGFGSIDLGRTYTPLFYTLLGSDATGLSGHTTVSFGQGLSTHESGDWGTTGYFGPNSPSRRSNSINYTSPSFDGLTIRAQIAQESGKQTINGVSANVAKSSALGLNVTYAAGPLSVSYAHDAQKGLEGGVPVALNAPAATSNAGKTTTNAFGGTYDFGVAKLYANWSETKAKATAAGNSDFGTAGQYNLGLTVPVGAITLIGQIGRNTLKIGDNTGSLKASGNDWVLGANYSLSKRTTAYVTAGVNGNLKTTIETVSVSKKTSTSAIGLLHTF